MSIRQSLYIRSFLLIRVMWRTGYSKWMFHNRAQPPAVSRLLCFVFEKKNDTKWNPGLIELINIFS